VAAAELLAVDCDAPGSTRLSSSAWAAFSLSACRDCIVRRQYTHALMLLRLANTAIAEEAAAPRELNLVERPVLRGFDKKPLMEIERPERFLLTPTPSPIPAAAPPTPGETMAFSSSRHVPLDGHADTPADFARGAAERPSLAAFHADMMALYLHRKGKDNEALQWYVLLVLSLYVLLVLSMYVLLVLSMYVLLVLSLYVLLVLSMHVLLVLSMHVLLVQSLSSILSYLWPILCFLIAARQLPHVMEAHVNTRLGYMTRPAYIFPSSGYIISSSGSFSLPCP